MSVDVGQVERTMRALLVQEGRQVLYRDTPAGQDMLVAAELAASRTGLLPALVVAGESVWREATGSGFALDVVRDPEALLGYRLQRIGDGSFTAVMLATMEAAAQAARPGVIVVNDLNAIWAAATGRMAQAEAQRRRAAETEVANRAAWSAAP